MSTVVRNFPARSSQTEDHYKDLEMLQDVAMSYQTMIDTCHVPKWNEKIDMVLEAMSRCEWEKADQLATEVLIDTRKVEVKFIRENLPWHAALFGLEH